MEVITGTTEHLIFIRTGSSYVKRWQRNKKKFEKNTNRTYRIFTPEKHLNVHNSLIKKHIAMNSAPLDSLCQRASSVSKKFYLAFSVLEKFAKKQKNSYFWGPHQQIGSIA
jgi:hypothetical protein